MSSHSRNNGPDFEGHNGDLTEPRLWNTVRFRFGILLALALLPWLILTALEAFDAYERNRASEATLADIIAENTVDEIGRTLEAGRLGLEAAPQIIADKGCETGAAEIIDRLGAFSALIVKDPSDVPICQIPASLDRLLLINPNPFSAEQNFRIEEGRLGEDGEAQPVVVLQSFLASTERTYTLILPQTLGLKDLIEVVLGDEAVVALTRRGGRNIIGADMPQDQHSRFENAVQGADVMFLNYVADDGLERRVASKYIAHLDLYVTFGRDFQGDDFQSVINPYTSMLLPILAWVAGFGMIWLGTQTMLLTPIKKVRLASRRFSAGKLSSRVNLSNSAAAEVQMLGTAFNRMAEQIEDRDNRLADNLDEKDTLMREIHHRVKNNLQIIISLLNMQERKAEHEEAISAIAETRSRINAITIVHQGLYESSNLRGIDMQDFTARLLSSLEESLGTEEAGITLSHQVDPCRITADSAIPVALFIVEAVTNASKHGVERSGAIMVAISKTDDDNIEIRVNDDGRGLGDPDSVRGIGTRLMKGFARQLSGTLTYSDNAPGLAVTLTFPLDDSPEQPFQVSRKRT